MKNIPFQLMIVVPGLTIGVIVSLFRYPDDPEFQVIVAWMFLAMLVLMTGTFYLANQSAGKRAQAALDRVAQVSPLNAPMVLSSSSRLDTLAKLTDSFPGAESQALRSKLGILLVAGERNGQLVIRTAGPTGDAEVSVIPRDAIVDIRPVSVMGINGGVSFGFDLNGSKFSMMLTDSTPKTMFGPSFNSMKRNVDRLKAALNLQ